MSVPVDKTYKLFVAGKFVRSESGRVYQPDGAPRTNVSLASRKDARDAVVAARAALPGWSGRTGYNRGQILYRLAEMLQTRQEALVAELVGCTGLTAAAALAEVQACIELCTWYAGLPDKLQQLLGSQNEVSGPFFNFSSIEPTGVVVAAVTDAAAPALLSALALALPLVAGGNTCVVHVPEAAPLPGLSLAEAFATSDMPAGTVNLLAGPLVGETVSNRDADGLLVVGAPDPTLSAAAAESVKRVRHLQLDADGWQQPESCRGLWMVEPFVEVKTLWHPTLL